MKSRLTCYRCWNEVLVWVESGRDVPQRKRSVGQRLLVHKITSQTFFLNLASIQKSLSMRQRFTSSKPHSVIGFRCLSVPRKGFVGNVGRL